MDAIEKAFAALPAQVAAVDFESRPLMVFWETTKACGLTCLHCRADAISHPLPGQLGTQEGLRMIEEIASFGLPRPILVLTGGDVLMRPDALTLARRAVQLGIPTCISPSVTALLSEQSARAWRDLGVRAVSLSLDGARPATHDHIRGIPGHHQRTLEATAGLLKAGLRVQINTTVMAGNIEEVAEVAALMAELGVPVWEVFFLVETGRGSSLQATTALANEEICHFLFDASHYGFVVRTVEAPFFRRVARWRLEREASVGHQEAAEVIRRDFGLGDLYMRLRSGLEARLGAARTRPASHTASTRDGKGIVFVSHDGSVYPSGFLPLGLGNVRNEALVAIYRDAALLRSIRAGKFQGRCGRCPFVDLCGGSRARAFAASGDPLGEDPGCAYIPA